MKGSLWVVTIALFVASMLVFSSGYKAVVDYFTLPTVSGLASIAGHLAVMLALLGALGFIIYATERRAGNVKVKNALFERLLGYASDAPLPTRVPEFAKKEGKR